MGAQNLKPFVAREIMSPTELIRFRTPRSEEVIAGYPAILLWEICKVYTSAEIAGELLGSQWKFAERARSIERAAGATGIIGVIDSHTDYERMRRPGELASIFQRYITSDAQGWLKTFQDDFYDNIHRLKGWEGSEHGHHPHVVAHYTNKYVYGRMAPHILGWLQEVNPMLESGGRATKHHQHLTREVGYEHLKDHLSGLTALMRAASDWPYFERLANQSFPLINETMHMRLPEDN